MGWEKRRGRLFYYRKMRVGQRVRSVYMGRGEDAIAASLADGVAIPDGVRPLAPPPAPEPHATVEAHTLCATEDHANPKSTDAVAQRM